MLFYRFIISFCLIFLSVTAYASEQANLIQLYSSEIDDDKYNVTLLLDRETIYQVISKSNEIIIDLTDTNFALKTLPNKLNGNFIKAIRKVTNGNKNLQIIINLAEEVELDKIYNLSQDKQLCINLDIINKDSVAKNIEVNKNLAEKNYSITKNFIIMIDPGHGGVDKGTISSNLHILEKNLTLEYAKELASELAKYPQYKVLMTRDKDVYLSPEQRRKKALEMKVDLFISIHADFNSDPQMRGASIYTLSQEAMNKDMDVLVERKNKGDILKNGELLNQNQDIAKMLINMVYENTQNSSINLAKATTIALTEEVEMLKKSHREAGLKVLKGVDTPAILVELGFLSNKEEEELLNTIKHKKMFIQALVQGINQYVNIN